MASKVYESSHIYTIDGDRIYITPLKIKFLREFMEAFEDVKAAISDEEAISKIVECARIAMQQYSPSIKSIEDVEDSFDLPTMYDVMEIAAGISIRGKEDESQPIAEKVGDGSTWDTLDLVRLESEAFLLGIWKDYEELEASLSMPELVAILDAKRESDYANKRFLAAIQGIDLDEKTNKSTANAWENMKARVFSGGKAKDANDITALQGINAQKAGFGIGMGLGYQDLTKK